MQLATDLRSEHRYLLPYPHASTKSNQRARRRLRAQVGKVVCQREARSVPQLL